MCATRSASVEIAGWGLASLFSHETIEPANNAASTLLLGPTCTKEMSGLIVSFRDERQDPECKQTYVHSLRSDLRVKQTRVSRLKILGSGKLSCPQQECLLPVFGHQVGMCDQSLHT